MSEQPTGPQAGLGITAADLEEMLRQFNATTENLQRSHQRLQERVAELTRELEAKDIELQRKKRLEALGEMAAGVAHEIRNPLGGIQLYASMLEKDLQDFPDQLRLIRKITGGVNHLNTIVEDMLAFTRTLTPETRPVDIHGVIEEALGYLTASIQDKGVTVVRDFADSLPRAQADERLLQRSLFNVALNAQQAMGEEGTLTIATAADGNDILVRISDTGPGIDEAVLDKIFNPFFTSKDSGTGLGLAIVHRIVESHKGTVSADNLEGGGACFTIRLPAAAPE